MSDIILCQGCGGVIDDFEDRLHTVSGDWHFDCWLDRDDTDDE